MAVSNQTPLKQYTVVSGQTTYPVTFNYLNPEDVVVDVSEVGTLVYLSHYTVTADGVVLTNDGLARIEAALAVNPNAVMAITRSTTPDRSSDYPEVGTVSGASLNNNLDRPILLIQEVLEKLARAIVVSATQPDTTPESLLLSIFEAAKSSTTAATTATVMAGSASTAATTASTAADTATTKAGIASDAATLATAKAGTASLAADTATSAAATATAKAGTASEAALTATAMAGTASTAANTATAAAGTVTNYMTTLAGGTLATTRLLVGTTNTGPTPDQYSYNYLLVGGNTATTISNSLVMGSNTIIDDTSESVIAGNNPGFWGHSMLVLGSNNTGGGLPSSSAVIVGGNTVHVVGSAVVVGSNQGDNVTASVVVGANTLPHHSASDDNNLDSSLVIGTNTINTEAPKDLVIVGNGNTVSYTPVDDDHLARAITIIGENNVASHNWSFMHGHHLISGKEGQVIFGRYNEPDSNALLIVANGTAAGGGQSEVRKNVFTVGANGVTVSGTVSVVAGGSTTVLPHAAGFALTINGGTIALDRSIDLGGGTLSIASGTTAILNYDGGSLYLGEWIEVVPGATVTNITGALNLNSVSVGDAIGAIPAGTTSIAGSTVTADMNYSGNFYVCSNDVDSLTLTGYPWQFEATVVFTLSATGTVDYPETWEWAKTAVIDNTTGLPVFCAGKSYLVSVLNGIAVAAEYIPYSQGGNQ